MPALLIVGVIVILGGLALFALWIEHLLVVVKAVLPLGLMSLGGIMVYFGWEERKGGPASFMDFSSPAEASRYQAEALAYQEKLNGFQEESSEESTEVFGTESFEFSDEDLRNQTTRNQTTRNQTTIDMPSDGPRDGSGDDSGRGPGDATGDSPANENPGANKED
ncbi:MAG: hypothetical protein LBF41_05470 [Deltaproteobacteria bacterium]|jgi:hypothetical protein|nr:hypothetical protein [Deltaproteobacteria bacterium]